MQTHSNTLRLLQQEGLKAELISSTHGEEIIIRDFDSSKESLRTLGFRIADGKNDVRYLLYMDGSYCGVII